MAEADRADLERRLRIRRRNLERLKQEEKEITEGETPPAVSERIQAQIRVERDEVYLLEAQLRELDGQKQRTGLKQRSEVVPPHLLFIFRVVLGLLAFGLILAVVGLALPRLSESIVLMGAPPTDTPVPTNTSVPPTATSPATATALPSATSTPAPVLPTSTPTPVVPVGTVNVEVLNLRGGPTTDFGIRAKLTTGEKLNLLGRNELGTWLAVSTLDGATGWVAAEYVDIPMNILDLPVKEVEQ